MSYNDAAHRHAATSAGTNSYAYDQDGNMTTRSVAGGTFTLGYDAEGYLVTVTGPSMTASFVYDGDGVRVKSTINSVSTTFVGNHYEVSGSTVTKYYFAGADRIAMRTNGTLNYLLSDHLGSTSITTDAAGAKVAELRYKAWGEVRYNSGSTPTKYTYTGQYDYSPQFGLQYYNARWYDSYINQFSQPDNIVPDPYNPQDWNRYSYARNNPLRYTDPSGHFVVIATIAIGAVVGAAIGAGSYMIGASLSGRQVDLGELAIATAVGAGGGALIGTGVGAAAGGAILASAIAGAGVGAVTAEAAYNVTAGDNYDTDDMLIATGVGTVAGAATGGLGASSAAGTTAGFVAQTAINGVAGGSQNLLTQLNRGAELDNELLLESASVGLLTAGTTGLVGHVADRYLPSQASQLRLWSGTAMQSPGLSQRTVTSVIGSLVTAETVTGTVRGTFANVGSNLMTRLALAR